MLTFKAQDWALQDPVLSDLGLDQCKQLREKLRTHLPGHLDVNLVLVSPMKRTLQTAMASVDWLLEKGVPIVAHAGWQETTDNPCDIGSPINDVAKEFPDVDFSQVDPIFPDKLSERASFYANNRRALLARGQQVLAELYARPEPVVLVVSHSAFLRKAVSSAMFNNADYRIFSFEDAEAPPASTATASSSPATKENAPADVPLKYRLREWDETRKGHGGMGWSSDYITQLGDELPE